jgi:predicted transcriptional regulator
VWYAAGLSGGQRMPDEPLAASINREVAARIVAGYVRRNQIGSDQIAPLISTVHQALAALGAPPAEALVEQTPAVSIRRSVQHDHVTCLDCGWRGQVLRLHLTTAHRLSVAQYRTRWSLPVDHAVTAPAYSERRSMMAKQIGLGRGRPASAETMPVPVTETATAPQPSPTRRGRPRSKATTAAPA